MNGGPGTWISHERVYKDLDRETLGEKARCGAGLYVIYRVSAARRQGVITSSAENIRRNQDQGFRLSPMTQSGQSYS